MKIKEIILDDLYKNSESAHSKHSKWFVFVYAYVFGSSVQN